jgi:hypothetical protein
MEGQVLKYGIRGRRGGGDVWKEGWGGMEGEVQNKVEAGEEV